MNGDEPSFVHAILSAPEDRTVCRVYADWLEEQGDSRAEFVRLWCGLTADPHGDEALEKQLRLRELRTHVTRAWRAAFGDYECLADFEDEEYVDRMEQIASLLKRPRRFVASDGYEQEIVGGALLPLGSLIAYVERLSRSEVDIDFTLHSHAVGERSPGTPVKSYNPFFGCRVRFFEWYGNSAIVIYREKHNTYAARFGPKESPVFQEIEDDWGVDGVFLNYRGYRETQVRRLTVPGLEELPPLAAAEAERWGIRLSSDVPGSLLFERHPWEGAE